MLKELSSSSSKSVMIILHPFETDTPPSWRRASLKPFFCKYCDRYFSNFDFFKRHVVRHKIIYSRHWKRLVSKEDAQQQVVMLYQCVYPSCSSAFLDVAKLARHIQCHVPQDVIRNREDRRFDTGPSGNEDTLIDMFGKDVNDAHECDICQTFFSTKLALIGHKLTHSTKTMYECDICRKELTTRRSLNNHKLTHLPMHECDICHKLLTTKQTLDNHRLNHFKDKPFPCDKCKSSFVTLSSLRAHNKRTHGGKPFPCDMCGKWFGTRDILRRHVRTHTGEKPYVCEECGKSFKQVSNLISHRRANHTGEKPFVCPTCNKAFSQKFNLTKHIRTHTGEKPYRCAFCNQHFPRTDNLKVHISARHPGKQIVVYKVQ